MVVERNKIMSFASTWMQVEIIILNEISQKEKDKHSLTYTWNPKHNTNRHIYETETDARTDNRLLVAMGEAVGGSME